ncbi:class I SAM-dependent methyltransferase [Fulvimonas soli]|jgi:2-polyprenyl-3-methyl-5-hydroxy-6-metoxy-1,4-benzoquinol methylase|uniref:Methyltransferase family protein n=1 Tax=Fulvimonas soli TaxID=155197 RepID=A0A316IB30_9GAMM|nr:class I SAM-dependent methyltransferase [Fulvimonas soli]PWK87615.1 methyltransferase family protein [Fulvimonas soli]
MTRIDRAARRAIAARFSTRYQRGYVGGKLAGDPLYAAIAGRLADAPALPLLDVGCGLGLLGHYLHAAGVLHGYVGVDHDERKIDAGRVAAAALGGALELRHADVAELPDFRGHVALLDVLHYLPAGRQPVLLRQLAPHVAPGGLLLLRNVLRERHWRFHATVLEEQFLYYSGWMRVRPTHYPSAEEIAAPLRAAGLEVAIEPLWGRTPFNSYLVVARRPG